MGCAQSLSALDDELEGNSLVSDACRVFRLVDKDGSGTISTKEFAASEQWGRLMKMLEMQKKRPVLPEEPTLKDFVVFITKLDQIDAAVALEFMEKELVLTPIGVDARELFDLLDADKSMSINLKTEAGPLADYTGKLFLEEMDKNGDGNVSRGEFLNAIDVRARQNPARTGLVLRTAVMHVKKKRDVAATQIA